MIPRYVALSSVFRYRMLSVESVCEIGAESPTPSLYGGRSEHGRSIVVVWWCALCRVNVSCDDGFVDMVAHTSLLYRILIHII